MTRQARRLFIPNSFPEPSGLDYATRSTVSTSMVFGCFGRIDFYSKGGSSEYQTDGSRSPRRDRNTELGRRRFSEPNEFKCAMNIQRTYFSRREEKPGSLYCDSSSLMRLGRVVSYHGTRETSTFHTVARYFRRSACSPRWYTIYDAWQNISSLFHRCSYVPDVSFYFLFHCHLVATSSAHLLSP